MAIGNSLDLNKMLVFYFNIWGRGAQEYNPVQDTHLASSGPDYLFDNINKDSKRVTIAAIYNNMFKNLILLWWDSPQQF